MSGVGFRTKKVTTYGKKKTHVIAIHDDFATSLSPARNIASASVTITETALPKRPVLSTKLSNDIANVVPIASTTLHQKTDGLSKVSKAATAVGPPLTRTARENIKPRKVGRPGRPARPKATSPGIRRPSARTPHATFSRINTISSDEEEELIEQAPRRTREPRKAAANAPRYAESESDDSLPRPRARRRDVSRVVETSTSQVASKRLGTKDVVKQLSLVSLDEPDHADLMDSTSQPTATASGSVIQPATLGDLLALSSSPEKVEFTAFLSAASPLHSHFPASTAQASLQIRKIGEASYSEVFACSRGNNKEIMLKIVPLHNSQTLAIDGLPDVSDIGDVIREVAITRRMGQVPGGGYIEFLGSHVVQGQYPALLVDEWWKFKRSEGSASISPERFAQDQHYAIILLSDGGTDLETLKFDATTGWLQAAGLIWQVADALARAEMWTNFEHRDLHEGQILIMPHPTSSNSKNLKAKSKSKDQGLNHKRNYLDPENTGIKATIIDFGLSRLDIPGSSSAAYSLFPEEVYEGKGEQWDVYRRMREVCAEDWAGFWSVTNVMWLHYLTRYLLHHKRSLKKPRLPTSLGQTTTASRPPRRVALTPKAAAQVDLAKQRKAAEAEVDPENVAAYESLCAFEEVLRGSLARLDAESKGGRRSRRGLDGQAGDDEEVELGCAGDVIRLGRDRGWIV